MTLSPKASARLAILAVAVLVVAAIVLVAWQLPAEDEAPPPSRQAADVPGSRYPVPGNRAPDAERRRLDLLGEEATNEVAVWYRRASLSIWSATLWFDAVEETIAARQAAARAAYSARRTTYTAHVGAGGSLASIRACESGGNYGAVSSTGRYRGAYQFDYETWASVGGSGDPAAAPPAEQDARAAALLARSGTGPWPVCGR